MSTETHRSQPGGALRQIAASFVVEAATGVCIRTRIKGLTDRDAAVLRQVGAHLGGLASADLVQRVRLGWATTRMPGPIGNGS